MISASRQLFYNQLSWSSSLLLLFLIVPASVPSDNWERAGPTWMSSPPPLVCRACRTWLLGRFQDARVAIQRIRAPKTARRRPRKLTKSASGGESLYLGLLLNNEQKLKLHPIYNNMTTLYICFEFFFQLSHASIYILRILTSQK